MFICNKNTVVNTDTRQLRCIFKYVDWASNELVLFYILKLIFSIIQSDTCIRSITKSLIYLSQHSHNINFLPVAFLVYRH